MILKAEVRRLVLRLTPLAAALPLGGCDWALLNPKGPVGDANKMILVDSVAIMLAIVIPTIVATLGVAWWWRSSNARARYLPDFEYSGQLELIVWAIPILTVMLLGGVAWIGSHDLDPARPLASKEEPLNLQVVSLDWKWLFIYPDLNVATVNHLVFPVDTPVAFTLTSDSVVTSFFIPQLGSQIYAMPGNRSRLNLLADEPGEYSGQNQQFSGNGFADMHFRVTVVPAQGFATWVQEAKRASAGLDAARFRELESPGIHVEATSFSAVEAGLFDGIVRKFSTGMPADPRPSQPGADVSREH
jgi:cytochrome o ubiquinol oxidase subunit 2